MITKSKLKKFDNKYRKLCIASGLRCAECASIIKIYRETVYLHNLNILKIEDDKFLKCLLTDLETHIRENHPDRAEYFLDRMFKGDK